MAEITFEDVLAWLKNNATDDEVHQTIIAGQRTERSRRRALLSDPEEIAREVLGIQNVTLTNRAIGVKEITRLLSNSQPSVIVMHTLDEIHYVIVTKKDRSVWAGKPAYNIVQIGDVPTEKLIQLISESNRRAWSVLNTYNALKVYQTESSDIFDALAEYLTGQQQ